MTTPGELLREARQRRAVSQQRLAVRASTTQSAISRIERDRISPSVETLRELLFLLGEDLVLSAEGRDSGIDQTLIRERLALTPAERLDYGIAFGNQVLENSPNGCSAEAVVKDRALPPKAPDLDALLGPLVRHGVDFVLIGGMAGISHGSNYPSFDLEVLYADDRANVVRLLTALEEIGVRLRGAPAGLPFRLDAETIENGANLTFITPQGDLDVLADAAGMPAYADLRSASLEREIAGYPIRVASLDHLIAMKRAAGQTLDKLLVEEYLAIAAEQQGDEAAD